MHKSTECDRASSRPFYCVVHFTNLIAFVSTDSGELPFLIDGALFKALGEVVDA